MRYFVCSQQYQLFLILIFHVLTINYISTNINSLGNGNKYKITLLSYQNYIGHQFP
jgi:hypothetical protein